MDRLCIPMAVSAIDLNADASHRSTVMTHKAASHDPIDRWKALNPFLLRQGVHQI
jgi:hypothetical protein